MWRYLVIARFPDVPVSGIGLDDIDWKRHAFNSSLEIKHAFQLHHLSKRFAADAKSKEYLRLFCCISAPGDGDYILSALLDDIKLAPQQATSCTTMQDVWITFVHPKLPSVIVWDGEKERMSALSFYAVDRKCLGNRVELKPLRYVPKCTILSRAQYSHVGKIAYKDENYFDTSASISYNHSTSHGVLRNGFAKTSGIGSNSKSFDSPNIAVSAWTSVACQFNLDYLFNQFIGYDN